MPSREERRKAALIGSPELWENGPGSRLMLGEEPITYAHYQSWSGRGIVGVFLTSRRLFVQPYDEFVGYRNGSVYDLADVAFAGRIRGPVLSRGGAWALTVIRAPDDVFSPAHPWVFIPRQALSARLVSRLFLKELRARVPEGAWRRSVPLPMASRLGSRDRFFTTHRELACRVNPRAAAIGRAVELKRTEFAEAFETLGLPRDLSEHRKECDEHGHYGGPTTPTGWELCGHCGQIIRDPAGWPEDYL
jgi:hypothetical protein